MNPYLRTCYIASAVINTWQSSFMYTLSPFPPAPPLRSIILKEIPEII